MSVYESGREEKGGELDEAATIAVRVSDGKVDSVAGVEGRGAVVDGGIGGCSVEGGGARGEVGLARC